MKAALKSYLYCAPLWLFSAVFWLHTHASLSEASDSVAVYGSGGLNLIQSDEISLDSEELYISPRRVSVKYRFTNHSHQEIKTLISFPITSMYERMDLELNSQTSPLNVEDLVFRTTVDGAKARSNVLQRPEVNGRNVSSRLSELGWPDNGDPTFFLGTLDELTYAQKEKLIEEGLLRRSQKYRKKYQGRDIAGNWVWSIYMTREAIFPAHKTVEVTHSFIPPVVSSSYDDWQSSNIEDRFCVEADFLDRIDNREFRASASAISLRYLLKSSANWRGPIKKFKLFIDKGVPESLLRTCVKDLHQISPTQFKLEKTNYEPDEDLDILIVY